MRLIGLYPLFFLVGLIIGCNQTSTSTSTPDVEADLPEEIIPMEFLRHVVLFKFNDQATAEIIGEIEQSFASLADKIPAIHSFEWGINNSPEERSKGLTHCFLVTFATEEDRQAYLPHPDHQAFVKFIAPYVEDVTVVDYWVK